MRIRIVDISAAVAAACALAVTVLLTGADGPPVHDFVTPQKSAVEVVRTSPFKPVRVRQSLRRATPLTRRAREPRTAPRRLVEPPAREPRVPQAVPRTASPASAAPKRGTPRRGQPAVPPPRGGASPPAPAPVSPPAPSAPPAVAPPPPAAGPSAAPPPAPPPVQSAPAAAAPVWVASAAPLEPPRTTQGRAGEPPPAELPQEVVQQPLDVEAERELLGNRASWWPWDAPGHAQEAPLWLEDEEDEEEDEEDEER
jgi:hypothetical protein